MFKDFASTVHDPPADSFFRVTGVEFALQTPDHATTE